MGIVKILPPDLPAVSTTVQALDNHWVPTSLLRQMLDRRLSLSDVREERNRQVRTEFIRSLVNSEAVVVAHSTYINEAVVGTFLATGGPEHRDFVALLNDGVLIPFLMGVGQPDQLAPRFTYNAAQKANWDATCREAPAMRCLRLDWDDARDKEKRTTHLAGQFHARLTALQSRDAVSMAEVLGQGTDAESASALRKALGNVVRFCADHVDATSGAHVAREDIYKKFVCTPGTDPVLGFYDRDKLSCGPIKQMTDLIYTSNLADALGRFPLTPIDSPARTVLQELSVHTEANEPNPDDLVRLLTSIRFDLIQRELFLKSYGLLTLQDVIRLRGDAAWHRYIAAVRGLVAGTNSFTNVQGVAEVFGDYAAVVKRAGSLASERRRAELTAVWEPWVKVALSFGPATINVVWKVATGEVLYDSNIERVITRVGEAASPVVARLVVAGKDHILGDPVQDEVAASIVFYQGRVRHAGEFVRDLDARLRSDKKFLPMNKGVAPATPPGIEGQG